MPPAAPGAPTTGWYSVLGVIATASAIAYSPPPPPPPPRVWLFAPAPPPPAPQHSTLSITDVPAGLVQFWVPAVVNSVTVEIADGLGAAWIASGLRAVPMMPGSTYSAPRAVGAPTAVGLAVTAQK